MNGRSIAACALALAFIAVSGRTALAQGRGQDTTSERESEEEVYSQDEDALNEADSEVVEQQELSEQPQFNDNDRQVTRDWYEENRLRLGIGWRDEDRLSVSMQGRLRTGERLDPELRQRMVWLPPELSARYGPAPRGYRYAVIGGNVVMIDAMYEVHDVFSLDAQVGRRAFNHVSFNDQDRQFTRDYYRRHRRTLGAGWRQRDRLSPVMQARLRTGRRLDPELRAQMYWVPPELSARYGPAPRGYRYAIIGGNVVLLDDAFRVHDVFRLSVRF